MLRTRYELFIEDYVDELTTKIQAAAQVLAARAAMCDEELVEVYRQWIQLPTLSKALGMGGRWSHEV